MNLFRHSYFWKNYPLFCHTRSLLSAYLMWSYLQWRTCDRYLEIGVAAGASAGLVLEHSHARMWLVDPQDHFRAHLGDPLPPRVLYQQVESDRMRLDTGLRFDLIMIDGAHLQPWPTRDVLSVLPHCHEHTLLWLDDYDPDRWPGMEHTRGLLEERRWRPWLRDDQTEWWCPAPPALPHRPMDLPPVVDRMLADPFITQFATCHRDAQHPHIQRFTQPHSFNQPDAAAWLDPLLAQHGI